MRTVHMLRHGMVWLAVVGMCAPMQALAAGAMPGAADAPAVAFAVSDVALAGGGLLTGQLLDEQMRPLAGSEVAISANGHTVAVTATDANGVFVVAGLRSGFHQITAAGAVENCRFWAVGTAPPRADAGVRIVAGEGVVRGQWGPPPMTNNFVKRAKVWATNPFVVGGVIAAAVAIPVALNNDGDGPSS